MFAAFWPLRSFLTLQTSGASEVKNFPAVQETLQEDVGLIPVSGRSPGKGNGDPLQDSCLGNPGDGGAWRATVHGIAKSWTRLSKRAYILINDSLYLHKARQVRTLTHPQ